MAEDNGDKTEQPSDHRRQEIREQGNIPRSVDMNAALLLFAGACAMQFWGAALIQSQGQILQSSLSAPAWLELDVGLLLNELRRVGLLLLLNVIPFLLVISAICVAGNLGQVGFVWLPEQIQPKWERLNPLSGLQRIFSSQGLVRLGGGMAKLIVLSVVAGWYLWSRLVPLLNLSEATLEESSLALGSSLVSLAFLIGTVLLVLALGDYGYQWWKFEQDIKMTKEEVREEMRNMEGDPQIKSRRRDAHRKLAASRQMQAVPTADVIITNPTELAIAIRYDAEKMAAPVVVAKGADEIAARIRRIAAEHGVPIVEKKPLAQALYRTVKVGQAIPVDLYEAVAEILAYVYRLAGKTTS